MLERFVAVGGKKYMAMTKEWSSKTLLAAKSNSPPKVVQVLEQIVQDQVEQNKDSNPGLAGRMS